jgi:hypothetical protein
MIFSVNRLKNEDDWNPKEDDKTIISINREFKGLTRAAVANSSNNSHKDS